MSELTIKYTPSMKRLLDSSWLNADTLGYIAGEILASSVGQGGVMQHHFSKGQGTWPSLAKSTIARKGNARIFYGTGKVLTAITTTPKSGELLTWGGSADIYSNSKTSRKRYNANGIWASAQIRKDELSLAIGFAGQLKHSAQFRKMRKHLASGAGIDVKGAGASKRISNTVSVGATERALRRAGKPFKKYEAMGAKGYVGNKAILARGKDNLAYANIVQVGAFGGATDHDTGQHLSPKGLAWKNATGGLKNYSIVRTGKKRELLPYQATDAMVIQAAIEKACQQIFNKIERG